MNKQDRALVVEALKACKPILWDGQRKGSNPYICFALETAAIRGKCTYRGASLAKNIIMSRLRHSHTVYIWLLSRGYRPLTDRNVQEYRHRWVDALIKEFSE